MDWFKNRLFRICLFLVMLGLCGGCYSFKSPLPPDLKTIAIPVFEDHSPPSKSWVGLPALLTKKLVATFVRENILQVVENEKNVNLLLKGTIIGVEFRKSAVGNLVDVKQEQGVVTVKVECLNHNTGKPLWSGTVSNFDVISGDGGLAERERAINKAVELVVEDIFEKIITASW